MSKEDKPNKKRPSKYEEKLKVNATFDEILKATVKNDTKKKK